MLQEIYIKDFALIREMRISFGPGLNIITGETGAGKSILLGALGLVLGSKATTDMIRSGSARAVVEAVFELPDESRISSYLDEHGIDCEDQQLVLRREISIEGKGRSFINSRQVPSSLLRSVGSFLVDIHGQNEHQNILQVSNHRQILDRYAGIGEETEKLRLLHAQRQENILKIKSVSLNEEEKNRRLEILRHEIAEIEQAAIKDGRELEELISKEKTLANAEGILRDLSDCHALLSEDEHSLIGRLKTLERLLEKNSQYDSSIHDLLNSSREAFYLLEDVAQGVRSRADSIQIDPETLQIMRDRIDLLQSLLRKYGPTLDAVRDYLEKARSEYSGIEISGEEQEKLGKKTAEIEKQMIELAGQLSEKRKKAAVLLEEKVREELSYLGMADVQVKLSLKWEFSENGIYESAQEPGKKYEIFPAGLDIVEFLLAASNKESLRPLRKIASGGEMSRIMLALKILLIHSDPVGTMVFDEVDAGIGGSVAEKVGNKLQSLAVDAQVLVITHLHQIAALSPDNIRHFRVSKDSENGSRIVPLNREQRIREIARMLGGEDISESAMQHARSLIS